MKNNPIPNEGWSDERVVKLINLFNAGLSASQIARNMGIGSRNAVIGKLRRLRRAGVVGASINAPHRPIAPTARPKVWHLAKNIKARRVLPPKPIVYEKPTSEVALALADIRPNQCRFIEGDYRLGDMAEAMMCGAQAPKGKSYCGHHQAITSYAPKKGPSFNRMVLYFGAR